MRRFASILSLLVCSVPAAALAQDYGGGGGGGGGGGDSGAETAAPPDGTTQPKPGLPPTAAPPAGAMAPMAAPAPAPAASPSDFMDSRIAFTCGDEDMLRDPKVLPTAPGFHCGRPNSLGVLFLDNYDTRFTGFETLSYLALYKHWSQAHWDVEGSFVVRVNEFSEDNIRFSDGGTYVRAVYYPDETRSNKTNIAFVAFPVSSDRMRLGYSYRISWGGSPEYFKPNPDVPSSSGKNPESVPGAKIQLSTDKAYAYVGLKTSLLLDPVTNEKLSALAFLGGAGVDVTPMLRVEANGGYFDRGGNELPDVLGEKTVLYGASAQVALHNGYPVGSSIDYALYRNDPTSVSQMFAHEQYPGGLSWLVTSEGTVLGQTLKDPEKTGSTKTQLAHAADLNVRVKYNRTRFKADLMTRDLAYILHVVPSLPTYSDFPSVYTKTAEYYFSAGVDQYYPETSNTFGVTLGVDIPATLSTPSSMDIPGNMTSSTTLVVRNETASGESVLPTGTSVAPVFAVKGSAKHEWGNNFALLGNLYYQYDANTVRYDRAPNSPESSFNRATFAGFNQVGFDITMQARF